MLESIDDIMDPLSNRDILNQVSKERFMSELNQIDIEKALENSETSSDTFESQYSESNSDDDDL